jgi:cytidylate kinase
MAQAPVITIDGPSGSGKGTIAQLLAKALRWHYLDSGALYRAIAWVAMQSPISLEDEDTIKAIIKNTSIEMSLEDDGKSSRVYVNKQEVTREIRVVECAQMASKLSALPFVREALLDAQKKMRQQPGLVTDGRDMGTVIFPDAIIKFYLEASLEERAKRRFLQLKAQGKDVSLPDVEREMRVRDERDIGRAIAPLKPAPDAIKIDTSDLDAQAVFQLVLEYVNSFNLGHHTS